MGIQNFLRISGGNKMKEMNKKDVLVDNVLADVIGGCIHIMSSSDNIGILHI